MEISINNRATHARLSKKPPCRQGQWRLLAAPAPAPIPPRVAQPPPLPPAPVFLYPVADDHAAWERRVFMPWAWWKRMAGHDPSWLSGHIEDPTVPSPQEWPQEALDVLCLHWRDWFRQLLVQEQCPMHAASPAMNASELPQHLPFELLSMILQRRVAAGHTSLLDLPDSLLRHTQEAVDSVVQKTNARVDTARLQAALYSGDHEQTFPDVGTSPMPFAIPQGFQAHPVSALPVASECLHPCLSPGFACVLTCAPMPFAWLRVRTDLLSCPVRVAASRKPCYREVQQDRVGDIGLVPVPKRALGNCLRHPRAPRNAWLQRGGPAPEDLCHAGEMLG